MQAVKVAIRRELSAAILTPWLQHWLHGSYIQWVLVSPRMLSMSLLWRFQHSKLRRSWNFWEIPLTSKGADSKNPLNHKFIGQLCALLKFLERLAFYEKVQGMSLNFCETRHIKAVPISAFQESYTNFSFWWRFLNF